MSPVSRFSWNNVHMQMYRLIGLTVNMTDDRYPEFDSILEVYLSWRALILSPRYIYNSFTVIKIVDAENISSCP